MQGFSPPDPRSVQTVNRPSIAIVADWYVPRIGGLELHLRDLSRHLARAGHRVDVVCMTRDDGSRPGDWESPGVRIHRLGVSRLPGLDTIRDPSAVPVVEALLRELRPDIIHTHNAFSPLSHVGAWLSRKLGIPSLFTECSVLRGRVGWALRQASRVADWGRWPTLLSGVSGFVADDVAYATRRDEVFVLHNGIDLAAWAGERREPSRPRVTTVMRFTRRKRPLAVVRIIPRVHAALPPPLRPTFTLVGDGPEMPAVVAESRRLGVSQYVELPGFQPRERVRSILAESSLFCLPTRKEAMSIATLEALASGCPAVAMNLGGVSDVVEHGREGFLAGSEDEFVDYIVRLIREHDLRQQMAARTRDRLGRFSWEQVIARHQNLFGLAQQREAGAAEWRLNRLGERMDCAAA